MRERDLKRIEHELGVALPARYREFMLAYPFPKYSWAGDLAMPEDVDLLLDLNHEARKSDSDRSLANVFVIGSDGGRTDYFIRLADTLCGVHS
jgi:SMI1 / KNR4 family (SUKH-1)